MADSTFLVLYDPAAQILRWSPWSASWPGCGGRTREAYALNLRQFFAESRRRRSTTPTAVRGVGCWAGRTRSDGELLGQAHALTRAPEHSAEPDGAWLDRIIAVFRP
jgi:hypothetical protein